MLGDLQGQIVILEKRGRERENYLLNNLQGQIIVLEKKEREIELLDKQSARANTDFRKKKGESR